MSRRGPHSRGQVRKARVVVLLQGQARSCPCAFVSGAAEEEALGPGRMDGQLCSADAGAQPATPHRAELLLNSLEVVRAGAWSTGLRVPGRSLLGRGGEGGI